MTATTSAQLDLVAIPSAPLRLVVDAQSTGVVIVWEPPEEAGTGGAVTGYNIWRWHVSTAGWFQIVVDTSARPRRVLH